ncbi:hypothetical protein HDU91_005622 [Kappamyces sp. JEL0680]|nr:hypothetical protein HDU91_005622 [Kappamyces sp. JEL0680]
MPSILFLGSGFVAGPCLDLLLKRPENLITIACRRKETAVALGKSHPQTTAISLDAGNQQALEEQVSRHDLVISLIPYTLHAKPTMKRKRDAAAHATRAKQAGITVFNEVGVDPGIDHLYAIKTIDEVHAKGGKVRCRK